MKGRRGVAFADRQLENGCEIARQACGLGKPDIDKQWQIEFVSLFLLLDYQ